MQRLLTAETSDKQLYDLANRLCLRIEPIVFHDELRLLKTPTEKRNYLYVIHLREPAHWIGLFLDNRFHKAYYFNSFAERFGEVSQYILDFIKRCKAVLYESDYPIQDPNRGYCGQYVLLWLSYMNRPTNDLLDFNDYLSKFKEMTNEIDKYKENNPDLTY